MQPSLKRYALLSLAAAVATIGLKAAAYAVTGSVGLLSDALESLVNLAAALIALYAISVAARPADEEHAYGHTKAEYLASGFEGGLIVVAAVSIGVVAVARLIHPRPIESLGLGAGVAILASLINLGAARVIGEAGRRYDSITLEADARHLMTDVWTSVGVVLGVVAAQTTGWHRLDPLIALAVAVSIVRTGFELIQRSMLGLLDTGLPEPLRDEITRILNSHREGGVEYHAVRTRQAGARRFISFHILVPGDWTVQRGHDLLETIEEEIRAAIPRCTVFTHLEPLEDPVSWADTALERSGENPGEE
ncbi:MAG TPA: cation diffusion facilitator family transporter [Longimicrobiaceae bacterium]